MKYWSDISTYIDLESYSIIIGAKQVWLLIDDVWNTMWQELMLIWMTWHIIETIDIDI